jgi:hypothetical protein
MEALVCASCPEAHQATVTAICLSNGIQKAYGRAGDMVKMLRGNDWIGKWQAKVVMAVVTKAQTLGVKSCKIICIEGGPNCDLELSHQPMLVKAIKQEMGDNDVRVQVNWMDFETFVDTYGGGQEKEKEAKKKEKCINTSSKSPAPMSTVSAKDLSSLAPNIKRQVKSASKPKPCIDSVASVKVKPKEAWICGECEKTFASEKALGSHQASTGHADPECEIRGKTFISSTGLRQHVEATGHVGFRPMYISVGSTWKMAIYPRDLQQMSASTIKKEFEGFVDFFGCLEKADLLAAVTSSPHVRMMSDLSELDGYWLSADRPAKGRRPLPL